MPTAPAPAQERSLLGVIRVSAQKPPSQRLTALRNAQVNMPPICLCHIALHHALKSFSLLVSVWHIDFFLFIVVFPAGLGVGCFVFYCLILFLIF